LEDALNDSAQWQRDADARHVGISAAAIAWSLRRYALLRLYSSSRWRRRRRHEIADAHLNEHLWHAPNGLLLCVLLLLLHLLLHRHIQEVFNGQACWRRGW